MVEKKDNGVVTATERKKNKCFCGCSKLKLIHRLVFGNSNCCKRF